MSQIKNKLRLLVTITYTYILILSTGCGSNGNDNIAFNSVTGQHPAEWLRTWDSLPAKFGYLQGVSRPGPPRWHIKCKLFYGKL